MTQLDLQIRSWGGRRKGAGRKRTKGRGSVPHRRRRVHDRHCPVHVTLRASPHLPSLRRHDLFERVRSALTAGSRAAFRVLQFSVQSDHVHLLVEADEPRAFERGVRGLAVRIARAVNGALRRRGRVWGDRYHARLLRTPREVRNALVYVLNNWKKHLRGVGGLDPKSSAPWFDGWKRGRDTRPSVRFPMAEAHTWLARIGWRRRGLIDPEEAPSGSA